MNANTGILSSQGIEILPEENVLRRDVGKDQVDFGLVTGGTASDNSPDDLQHWGNTGSTGDHTEVSNHIGSVDEGALGSTDTDGLANHERGHVLGDVALGIRLDQEIEVSGLVVTRNGSVRADNLLGSAIGLLERGANGDVLADRKTKDGLGGRELEAVAVRLSC